MCDENRGLENNASAHVCGCVSSVAKRDEFVFCENLLVSVTVVKATEHRTFVFRDNKYFNLGCAQVRYVRVDESFVSFIEKTFGNRFSLLTRVTRVALAERDFPSARQLRSHTRER